MDEIIQGKSFYHGSDCTKIEDNDLITSEVNPLDAVEVKLEQFDQSIGGEEDVGDTAFDFEGKDDENNFDSIEEIPRIYEAFGQNNGKRMFICYYCGYTSNARRSFVNHIKNHNNTCDLCKCEFDAPSSLMRHMRIIHKLEEQASSENKTTKSSVKQNNFKTRTGKRPYTKRNYKTNFQVHFKTIDGKKLYACDVCSYNTKNNCHLQRHLRRHSGEKPYACNICDYHTADSSNYQRHLKIHIGGKPYACNVCSYMTLISSNLQRHMKIHSKEKVFDGKECNFRTIENIYGVKKLFACNLCNYITKKSSNLQRHLKTHTRDKPFSCPGCGYKSKSNNDLQKHRKFQCEVKPFTCNVCSYKTYDSSNIEKHLKKHSEEFACNYCRYKTTDSCKLERHLRKHSGDKPHACSFCCYRTSRSHDLKKHERRVHTNKLELLDI